MSKVRVQAFYHASFEELGNIKPWLQAHACQLGETRWHQGDLAPAASQYDWLIVMGGPMSVHDDPVYPWLAAEKRAIQEAVQAGKCVLGLCLGAQLLALVLGADVSRNAHKEIGWMPVETALGSEASWVGRCMPDSFITFHWHGDTFAIPSGAVHLAQSQGCDHQGFSYQERVVGLQFHPEMTSESIQGLVAHCAEDLMPGPFVQPGDTLPGKPEYLAANALFLEELLAGLELRARG